MERINRVRSVVLNLVTKRGHRLMLSRAVITNSGHVPLKIPEQGKLPSNVADQLGLQLVLGIIRRMSRWIILLLLLGRCQHSACRMFFIASCRPDITQQTIVNQRLLKGQYSFHTWRLILGRSSKRGTNIIPGNQINDQFHPLDFLQ